MSDLYRYEGDYALLSGRVVDYDYMGRAIGVWIPVDDERLSRAEWEATIENVRLRCAAHSFQLVYGERCSWANEIGRAKAGPCDIGKYGFAAVGEETDDE